MERKPPPDGKARHQSVAQRALSETSVSAGSIASITIAGHRVISNTYDHALTIDGLSIRVSHRETTLLATLLAHPNQHASVERLALTVFRCPDTSVCSHALECLISRLRAKLEPHGLALQHFRRYGYMLVGMGQLE